MTSRRRAAKVQSRCVSVLIVTAALDQTLLNNI